MRPRNILSAYRGNYTFRKPCCFFAQKNEHKCVPCHHQEAFQVINGTAYIASSLLVLCPKQKHGAHLKKNQSFFRQQRWCHPNAFTFLTKNQQLDFRCHQFYTLCPKASWLSSPILAKRAQITPSLVILFFCPYCISKTNDACIGKLLHTM